MATASVDGSGPPDLAAGPIAPGAVVGAEGDAAEVAVLVAAGAVVGAEVDAVEVVAGRGPRGCAHLAAGSAWLELSITTTLVPSGAQSNKNRALSYSWRTQPADSGWPNWLTDWMSLPWAVGMLWKPMATPLGPRAKRTMNSICTGRPTRWV